MSLKQRGKIWHVRITAPSGEVIRHSTGTDDRQKALEYHDRLKAELWRVHKLGERPSRTWDEAALRWLNEKSQKRSRGDDVAKIRWLTGFLRGEILPIKRDRLDQILSCKGNSTANRYTALVRAIMYAARDDWDWIESAPKYRMRKEPHRRIRTLSLEKVKELIGYLPEHQRNMVIFALATGLRQGNIKTLKWADVDMTKGLVTLDGSATKNGQSLGVPLNSTAMEVLMRIKTAESTGYVFTYRGKPINQVSTKTFKAALSKAGVEDFRWHDLRHVWATWHMQNGTPLFALQEMAGWKSEAMVRRYAHLAPDHLRKYTTATEFVL